jgi:glyoxylase-like metal-dependent hydrolase (beta-lactamase superfamily II)
MSIYTAVSGFKEVRCIKNNLLGSNTYLGILKDSNDCIIIDPGLDSDAQKECGEGGITPKAVFCTHGHFDHIGGADYFHKHFDLKANLPSKDLKIASSSNFLLMALGFDERIVTPEFNIINADNAEIEVGSINVKYHPAPGHTPGSNIIQINNAIFTGDTLYSNGIGLSGLPGEDTDTLKETLLSIFETFPHDYIVFPGHGKPSILGNILKNNTKLKGFLGKTNQEKNDE